MRQSRKAELLKTVAVICGSPDVHEYRIGITAEPSVRRRSYETAVKLRYPHFVIIATELTRDEACEIEEALQTGACAVRTSRTYRKYDPTVRDNEYVCSTGGSDRFTGRDYSVYMTWK